MLRQPHRFEGLSLVVVVRPFFDLAGPQRADEGIAAGKLNAASLALGTHQEEANHALLARRAHLHVLQAPALPTLHPVANPLADTVLSSVALRVKSDVQVVYLNVGVHLSEDWMPVAGGLRPRKRF